VQKSGALLLDRQELIFATKVINSEMKTIQQNSQYLWSLFSTRYSHCLSVRFCPCHT